MKPPAEPNRERYVQRLLHTFPVALQQLASQGQLTKQQADSANAAAVQGLQRTRTLMMFMQSWRDNMQQPGQSQQSLSPAAEAFAGCWGLIQQALASGHATSAVQEGTAACCTAAVRMHLAASMAAMPGILHAAACGVASGHPTAYLWVPPLAAALDQLDGQQLSQLLLPLKESLRIVDSSVAAQNMVDRTMADANPELSLVCLLLNWLHCTLPLSQAIHSMQLLTVTSEVLIVSGLAGDHSPDNRTSKERHQTACSIHIFINSTNVGEWHIQGSCLHDMQPQRLVFCKPVLCRINYRYGALLGCIDASASPCHTQLHLMSAVARDLSTGCVILCTIAI